MTDFEHGTELTVERPGGEDRFGNPLPGTTHTVPGCALAPAGSTEAHVDASTVEWDYDVLGPYNADLKAKDVVTISGHTDDSGALIRYQVEGRPERYANPYTGTQAGMVAHIAGVEG